MPFHISFYFHFFDVHLVSALTISRSAIFRDSRRILRPTPSLQHLSPKSIETIRKNTKSNFKNPTTQFQYLTSFYRPRAPINARGFVAPLNFKFTQKNIRQVKKKTFLIWQITNLEHAPTLTRRLLTPPLCRLSTTEGRTRHVPRG